MTDSRPHARGIRRRRKCPCSATFTTVEVVVPVERDRAVIVRNRDGGLGRIATVVEPITLAAMTEAATFEREAMAARIMGQVRRELGL